MDFDSACGSLLELDIWGFKNPLVAAEEVDVLGLKCLFVNPANFKDAPNCADKYQRLVALKHPSDLLDYLVQYHCFSSYESDQEYLKFFDLMMEQMKYDDYYNDLVKAERKAESLAGRFRNLSPKLISICAMDAVSLLNTFAVRQMGSQRLFRVWEGVVKEKMDTEVCLQSVYYSPDEYSMVKNECADLLDSIFQIMDTTTDDDALKFVNNLLYKDSDPREGLYYDFIRMKESVAEKLGIIPHPNSVIGCSTWDACLNGGAADQWDFELDERVSALQLDSKLCQCK